MKTNKEQQKKITSIGGQALIEGILMRGPHKTVMAVRTPGGEIELEEIKAIPLKEKYPILGWPLIRGCVNFIESMKIGYKALAKSAEKSGFEEEEEPSKFEKWLDKTFGNKINQIVMAIGGVLGVALAVALFFLLPTWVFNLIKAWIGETLSPWRSVAEGIMRILIFILYVVLCSLMPDIRRVFQYHGAEHKTIFCYEADEDLTVENVRKHGRFHPRCGTSFMVIMLVLGIVIGFFIPFENPFLRTAVKLLCIPLVVGIGYELIKFCGRHNNWLTAVVAAPGKWMQRITVKEPDDAMIQVAIAAMKEVIPENGEDLL